MTSSQEPVPSAGPRLTIIADDLTGACDAAVPFAEHGLRTLVLTGQQIAVSVQAQVVAFSTETRDLAPDMLPQQLHQHLALFAEGGWSGRLFKKIDSALRGNTFAEVATLSHMLHTQVLVVAPAFPVLERKMKNGVQRIGCGAVQQNIDVDRMLRSAGIAARQFVRGLPQAEMRVEAIAAVKAGSRVLLFDAETQSDLESVVGALAPLDAEVLWVGSGGLAHALADALPATASRRVERLRRGKTIFFIGSDHPVTQSQITQLRTDHDIVECVAADHCSVAAVVVCRVQRGAALEQTAAFFSDVDPTDVGCIFVTGGDTASHLCRALEVTSIEMKKEFARGVPVGIMRGGPMEGVFLMTKSGGFGDGDLLSRVAAACSNDAGAAQ